MHVSSFGRVGIDVYAQKDLILMWISILFLRKMMKKKKIIELWDICYLGFHANFLGLPFTVQ